MKIKQHTFDITILAFVCCALINCYEYEFVPKFDEEYVEGYVPIYGEKIVYDDIKITESRSVVLPGKIITYESFIILEEIGEGFHFINNEDNTSPKNVGFLSIPSSSNIAIRSNVLYVDYQSDLLAIEINEDLSLNVTALNDVFGQQRRPNFLPPLSGYYVCVDTTLGIVARWEKTEIYAPQCYYNYQGD